jgi:CheY-like chemotaxis protein
MPSKVMIIDDSVLVLTIVRHQLEQAGFNVITRESALGTVAAVLREQPDVILVDVMMPALGGENLVTLLRRQLGNKDIRILFFSDKPPETLHALVQQVGADGFVTKGTAPEMLVAQLHACIKSRPTAAAPQHVAGESFALFVDRDAGLRALCHLMVPLHAVGFIHSGHEALRILQSSHPPSCIFAGAHLLDMRGEDLWHAAVAIDDFWRNKIALMSDPEHPLTPPTQPWPRWVARPTRISDIEAVQAAMRRP